MLLCIRKESVKLTVMDEIGHAMNFGVFCLCFAHFFLAAMQYARFKVKDFFCFWFILNGHKSKRIRMEMKQESSGSNLARFAVNYLMDWLVTFLGADLITAKESRLSVFSFEIPLTPKLLFGCRWIFLVSMLLYAVKIYQFIKARRSLGISWIKLWLQTKIAPILKNN